MDLLPRYTSVQHSPYQSDLVVQLIIADTLTVLESGSQHSRSQVALNGANGLSSLVNQSAYSSFADAVVIINDIDSTVRHLD